MRRRGIELPPLSIDTLQVNVTKLCNQVCRHCHVDAGPQRKEMLSPEGIAKCLEILERHPQITKLDITGGAPELHPGFDGFVEKAVALGKHVMVRHNLTVQLDGNPQTGESKEYLPRFFATNRVEVISSLPYYQEFFTDAQRGVGRVQKEHGGDAAPERAKATASKAAASSLNLVYNPVGPYLPAAQAGLEADYKRELKDKFGLAFNSLFTITNMPINRFKLHLDKSGQYEAYMEKLLAAFNPAAAAGVMCRSLVSVGHDGRIYDCDFNQMLEMDAAGREGPAAEHFRLRFRQGTRGARYDSTITAWAVPPGREAPAAGPLHEDVWLPMKTFGFAGWSGSGKTTLIEKLIPLFVKRGLRVSLIKHAHHTFDVDHAGQGFLPPPPRRCERGAGHLVAALGADARIARRAGAYVRGTDPPRFAVRPADRGRIQVRADSEAGGLACRAGRGHAAPERSAHRRRGERCESRSQGSGAGPERARGNRGLHPRPPEARMNKGLLSVDEALATLLAGARPVAEVEQVPTMQAMGRVLAQAQTSTMDVPPMDNSAMDGYAIRLADLILLNRKLEVAQRIAAGSVGKPLEPGTAARIFTGAPVPAGADAIVMQEHCSR